MEVKTINVILFIVFTIVPISIEKYRNGSIPTSPQRKYGLVRIRGTTIHPFISLNK